LETLIRALDNVSADILAPRLSGESGARLVRPATVGLDWISEPTELALSTVNTDEEVVHPPWLLGECLLARREVIAATGGFDDRYVPASLQDVDFCIQARRRGFCCAEIPLKGVIYRGLLQANWIAADVSALKSKWQSYPELIQS
jgi:GT2 family glycosyltransferase